MDWRVLHEPEGGGDVLACMMLGSRRRSVVVVMVLENFIVEAWWCVGVSHVM